jgi:hypothetical protein
MAETLSRNGWLWSKVERGAARAAGRDRAENPRRSKAVLLALEDRRPLSTFTVTSTADTMTAGGPTPNTLRWAVEQANRATSTCAIAFNLVSTPATIALLQGPLELSNTSASITIDGLGANMLSISGNQSNNVLLVDKGVTATISGHDHGGIQAVRIRRRRGRQ